MLSRKLFSRAILVLSSAAVLAANPLTVPKSRPGVVPDDLAAGTQAVLNTDQGFLYDDVFRLADAAGLHYTSSGISMADAPFSPATREPGSLALFGLSIVGLGVSIGILREGRL
jgi:hypothetical protein